MLKAQTHVSRRQPKTDATKEVTERTKQRATVTRAELVSLFRVDFAAMNLKVANDARF